jgi:hypothetical protein
LPPLSELSFGKKKPESRRPSAEKKAQAAAHLRN